MSRLSGPITISAEAVEEDGSRRDVTFEVPETDEELHAAIEQRWRKSFAELAYEDQPKEKA